MQVENCRVFDLINMSMFSDIGRPLNGHTDPQDTRCHTLHEFNLGNIPVVDRLVALPAAQAIHDYGILVCMKFLQSRISSGKTINAIDAID